MTVVIHHNPDCGTSRNVLAIIEAAGEAPVVIDYLSEGWTRPQLLALFAAGDLTPRTRAAHNEVGGGRAGAARGRGRRRRDPRRHAGASGACKPPIVCTCTGVRLCRPSEAVLDLLDRLPPGPLAKEDGTPLIDADGRRVG